MGKQAPPNTLSLEYLLWNIGKWLSCYLSVHKITFSISSLKAPRAPDVSLFPEIIGDTFAVAIVAYAINISLGKTFGLKYGYKVDSNQVSNKAITLTDRWDRQVSWCSQTAAVVILRFSVPVCINLTSHVLA